jgi:hypothetical protein
MNKNPSFKMKKVATTTSSAFVKTAGIKLGSSGGVNPSAYNDFYSPVLSKDFLELPQNLKERRSWYRFFYSFNEMVRRSVDLHSELPLSKIRLRPPQCQDPEKSQYILAFYQNMVERIDLFKKLLAVAHEYYLMGACYVFLEDGEETGPKNDPLFNIDDELQMPEEAKRVREKFDNKCPDYQGWERIQILPPDMVRITRWRFTDKIKAELLVPTDTQNLMQQLSMNPHADGDLEKILKDMPLDLQENIMSGNSNQFETDPYKGSHLAEILRKTGDYEEAGSSILDSCLRSLLLMDKYRQAQSQIATRSMTPKRVITAPKASFDDIEYLREQVDASLSDPDYTIITNYEITWNEIGANERILNLGEEYSELEKRLSAGLGVTMGLLTGESTYGGERISLEIINTQYMLFREVMQNFVENHIFKPVALKKGFWEYDKFGNKKLLYPQLSFTRLAIRDNDAIFTQLFDLYSKGSIPLSYILDLLGLDPITAKQEMERDMLTVNDSRFNDILNSLAQPVADKIVENSDLAEKLAKYLGVKWKSPEDEENQEEERFK